MARFRGSFFFWFIAAFSTVHAQSKLVGNNATPPKVVDLTKEGTADWTHWGHQWYRSFDYKATGHGQISDVTMLGGSQPVPHNDSLTAFTWSDGDAPGALSHTNSGFYTGSFAPGAGFAFHAPADTRLQTLRVYVGGYNAGGTFTARLSDGSAPDYVNSDFSATHNTRINGVYTLVYRAASSGQTLDITWINNRDLGPYTNVSLQAATLIEGTQTSRFVPDALREAFVLGLARDHSGAVWVGTEGAGVWRYDPNAPPKSAWRQFTTSDGLGENAIYTVACDKQNRVWVGHRNHGVSIFNGKQWKNYGPLEGPLGERIFRIAVCPTDGDVWIASSLGLSRYSVKRRAWSYFTRADGLPSDQMNALAFDKAGNIYAGSQCDGVAKAYAVEDYLNWHTTPGLARPPMTPTGKGLPSGLINDLLVARDGAVYAATTSGLAVSRDGGEHWTYRRGRNWREKAQRRMPLFAMPPFTDILPANAPGLPAEDAIMSLAEDAAGRIHLGHWRRGEEILPAPDAKPVQKKEPERGNQGDWVTAMLPMQNGSMWLGHYRTGGLIASALPKQAAIASESAALPAPAAPLSIAELASLTEKFKTFAAPLPAGGGAYLGEDWTTQGDWIGRYGRCAGVLAAVKSPTNDYFINKDAAVYDIEEQIGPHHAPKDSIRYWIQWVISDNPNVLYDPILGYRRQSDWDDHGEAYPTTHEGPDIWLTVTVPAGTHRVSLYIFNRTAHGEWYSLDWYRDYTVELRAFRPTLQEADALPALARTRVQNAWGGVYKQFVVQGPGKFYVKICRNESHNAICSGVFVDQEPANITKDESLAWLGEVPYHPPLRADSQSVWTQSENAAPSLLSAARRLWTALDAASGQSQTASMRAYRLLAYRAAMYDKGPEDMQANWRWQIGLWTEGDRKQFSATMAQAWQAQIAKTPALKAAAQVGLP